MRGFVQELIALLRDGGAEIFDQIANQIKRLLGGRSEATERERQLDAMDAIIDDAQRMTLTPQQAHWRLARYNEQFGQNITSEMIRLRIMTLKGEIIEITLAEYIKRINSC